MGRWSEFSACIVCQVVRLYSVVEIVVMSGEVACCSVVCGTLVGTLFTPDPAEYTSNLDLKIHNTALPRATHPKIIKNTHCNRMG